MFLIAILALIAIIVLVVAVLGVSIFGAAGILLFADAFVAVAIIVGIIVLIIKHNNKKNGE